MICLDCYSALGAIECNAARTFFFPGFPAPRTDFVVYTLCPVTIFELSNDFFDVNPVERWRVIRYKGNETELRWGSCRIWVLDVEAGERKA